MTSVIRGNGQLFYEVFGSGSEILLAFHGFGQDRNIFKQWSRKLESKYTIFAFDLFYHGESTRPLHSLSKKEWRIWIQQFVNQEGIERFSILGYSLGGRFAISTSISFHESVNKLILIAPDGIYLTPWFKLATTPGIRLIFKSLMMHPNRIEKWLSFNDRYKIINKYIADFARNELGDLENRKRVYRSWNYFKALGYTKKELIKHFNTVTYEKQLIVGDKDHIIKPSGILPIIEMAREFKVNHLPMKHHQLAKSEVAELLLID